MAYIDSAPAGVLSLAACQALCVGNPSCVAIVSQTATYTWTHEVNTNCYAGAGATELTPLSGTGPTACQQMTAEACKTQCVIQPTCAGVVFTTSGTDIGTCCPRGAPNGQSAIDSDECDGGNGIYDAYLLTRSAGSLTATGSCWRLSSANIANCGTEGSGLDTFVKDELPNAWWLTSHFAERSFMPRYYKCAAATSTCTLNDLKALLPSVQASGYSVVNIDWPAHSGPATLFLGFGILNATAVDPLLGTEAEWQSFVADAHSRGLKVIADFNPSYWWTGSPHFKQAEIDVNNYGLAGLPATSPARWFRWTTSCSGAKTQPPDQYDDLNGFTDNWVYSAAAEACYWAVWGGSDPPENYGGQPTADFSSPEWRAELTRIMQHWVEVNGLDGFLIDAPPDYLAEPVGAKRFQHFQLIASRVRATIIEPMHALGAVVFGEMYNLQKPTILRMLDGGRNTDKGGHGAAVVKGFPSKLRDMITAQDASGFDQLLKETIDIFISFSGSVRTQPHAAGPASIAGLQAAATAIFGGYYYVRMGDGTCTSPYGNGYGVSPQGNEWPGGCFGDWVGASAVAQTLIALRSSHALRPGTPRTAFTLSGTTAAYAALRTSTSGNADAAIGMLNFASTSTTVTISSSQLAQVGVTRPQTPLDVINGGVGPSIGATQAWTVTLPAYGWAIYAVGRD